MPDGTVNSLVWGFKRPFFPSLHLADQRSLEGHPWKSAFKKGRCVVPLTGFFEVENKRGAGQTYEFSSPEGRWLWAAGLWDVAHKKPRNFALIMVETPVIGHITQRPALLTEPEARAYLKGEMDCVPLGLIPLNCFQSAGAFRRDH